MALSDRNCDRRLFSSSAGPNLLLTKATGCHDFSSFYSCEPPFSYEIDTAASDVSANSNDKGYPETLLQGVSENDTVALCRVFFSSFFGENFAPPDPSRSRSPGRIDGHFHPEIFQIPIFEIFAESSSRP
jgi:hypothetical protein